MLGLLPPLPPARPKLDYHPRQGLRASLDGVPMIEGSFVQLFRQSDGQGLFSSRWTDATVTKTPTGLTASYRGTDVSGTVEVTLLGGEIAAKHRIVYTGEAPARVELAAGLLYAEPWRAGTRTPEAPTGQPGRKPDAIEGRVLARNTGLRLTTKHAALDLAGGPGLLVFDGEGYTGEWAQGGSRLWAGYESLPITKDAPLEITTRFRLEGGFAGGTQNASFKLGTKPLPNAVGPAETRLPLIPKPQKIELDYGRPVEITGAWSFPAGRPRRFDDFLAALARRFELPAPARSAAAVAVDGGLRDFKITPGAYELRLDPGTISIFGQEDEGVLNAMERLAALAYVRDGRLYLPGGFVKDAPKRTFRGVHLFVGPTARAFHARLWGRVLRPLGFNTVVLQTERTAWDALPNLRGGIVMSKGDLSELTKWYRSRTVEPIPLIQSFGHMEWLFAGGANRDLAFNPDVLYAIDPRKPRQKELLGAIWTEAASVMKPKAVHFGLDEVDMRGWPEDPALVTQLWGLQLPFLGNLAKRLGARPMLWGDMALAPDEAPDAANGHDRATAAARRAAIPRGALIADWHYKADAKPATFLRPLQTWRTDGFDPVASAWYRPENVRGLNLAADLERAGTLQTTWAGYESSEANMLLAMEQFSAMVLAADYSWSGRQDALDRLGYDPVEVFRRMYFDPPTPLKPTGATSLVLASGGAGAGSNAPRPEALDLARRTGVTVPAFAAPVTLRTLDNDAPLEADLTLAAPIVARRLYLHVGASARILANEPVARVVARLAGGKTVETTIRYGLDVVAPGDRSPTRRAASANGLSLVTLDLPPGAKLAGISLKASAPHPGLVLYGASVR